MAERGEGMNMEKSPVCPRCGAYLSDDGNGALLACATCAGVEPTLEQAHVLLDRIMAHWEYGTKYEPLGPLQRAVEVWCRVAGPPSS